MNQRFQRRHPSAPDPVSLRLALWLYAVGAELSVWLVLLPFEIGRSTLRGETLDLVHERLGKADRPPDRPVVVVHAVSVGEVWAAVALIEALNEELPGHAVILTTCTRQARRLAQRLRHQLPNLQASRLLPWDSLWLLRRWMHRLRPAAVVVVETEIWPNLYRVSRELAAPLFLVSGRIQRRATWAFVLARRFFGPLLGWTRWVGVQSLHERDTFLRIGAPAERTSVMGSLKADRPALAIEMSPAWRDALSRATPLIVAGSTRATEERRILGCFRSLRGQFSGLRLVLAPRHPRRARALLRLVTRNELQPALWSRPASEHWDVLILDEIGLLRQLYQYADIVVGGGTLAPCGGHNLLEAAVKGGPKLDHGGGGKLDHPAGVNAEVTCPHITEERCPLFTEWSCPFIR